MNSAVKDPMQLNFEAIEAKYLEVSKEYEEAKNAIYRLGLKLETAQEFPIDGTAHAVIVLKKVAATPAQYPRRYAKIKQAPL